MKTFINSISLCLSVALAGLALFAFGRAAAAQTNAPPPPLRWWKGNLHTHSLWSDGNDYPEMIVDWYKQRGYHFLALSDHNVLAQGQRWIDAQTNRGGAAALENYRKRFGDSWVEQRSENGKALVRLKPLNEYRFLFEEPGRFLLLQSEEISDRFGALPIHLNATNLLELILPQGGGSVLEVMQNNINAVLEQRKRTGQPILPHLNHPNFGWAVTAEDIARLRGERLFEVYNGHPAVHNHGDAQHPSTERLWDIALTQRLTQPQGELLYGIATDDSHHYHEQKPNQSNPGRGWVMVRARYLTPESLIAALEGGDFYASTGVRLKDVRFGDGALWLEIEPEVGVTYTTPFIGTRKDYDRSSTPALGADGKPLPVTRRYSRDIGTVLAQVKGPSARYVLKGDELYVRAKIVSSKPQANPSVPGEVETAWAQPVQPGR